MGSASRRRRLGFVAALLALVGGTLAISLAAGNGSDGVRGRAGPPAEPNVVAIPSWSRAVRRATKAQGVAAEFARSYLVYEAGHVDRGVRASLTRLCSRRFAEELLRSPVRIPPEAKPPRERLVGAPTLRPAIVEGSAGLLASARVMRDGRDERLLFSLAPDKSRWRVVGVGQ